MEKYQALHPNLATLAMQYDEIMDNFKKGRIKKEKTFSLLNNLIARDDNGCIWHINPSSGAWEYRNVQGKFIPSEPPTFGYKNINVKDFYPNDHLTISYVPIDEGKLYHASSLQNSTRLINDSRKNLFSALINLVKLKFM